MAETYVHSDFYIIFNNVIDIAMHLSWAVILCFLYHHFFSLKKHQGSKWMIFLPGAIWIGLKQIMDVCIVINYETPMDNVKSLLKLLLLYGSLFMIALHFYQGSAKQIVLITMLFAAVSEISRFLAFSQTFFWNWIYDYIARRFEEGYPAVPIEEFIKRIELLSLVQLSLMMLLFVGVLYCTIRYVRKVYKRRELPLHKTEFLFLMIPCTSSFLLCSLLRIIMFTTRDTIPKTLYDSFPLLICIVPLLLILCLFSMIYCIKLYQETLTLYEERNRNMVLEKQIVSMEEHARELDRVYAGIRSMKHDMKNQLAVLNSLIHRQQDTDKLLPDYLNQLNRTIGKLDFPFQTGSAVADSLLSMKYHEACENIPGIKFEAEDLIFLEENIIQPADLCIILGNALDNAIEACEKLEEKAGQEKCFIRLHSLYRQNMLLLTIENSYTGELSVGLDSLFPSTTKPDSVTHGIGMHNIKAAAERYRGGVSWKEEGNVFTLTVMLNLSN